MKYILDDKYEKNITRLYATDPYEFFVTVQHKRFACTLCICYVSGRKGEGFDGGMQ
jgi:hypothetical protein